MFTVLTLVSQFTMEFWTSVFVGGVEGLRTRGTAAFAAAAGVVARRLVLGFVVADRAVLAKSRNVRLKNCMVVVQWKNAKKDSD